MQKESIDISNYPMILAAQQQLYDYAVRCRFGASLSSDPHSLFAFHQQRQDPRLRCFLREEPKPSYSYIGLISMAILSSPEQKLVLADIYQWILNHYGYFRARGPGWRNSIRHNLSLNDCFIKAGRSANGKGHYWSIHPANLADFSSGDFRRRRAQRRVRKSMGFAVPEEEDEDDDELLTTNGTEHHFEHPLSKFPSEELHSNVTDLSLSSSTNSTIVTPNLLQRYFTDIQRVAISRLEQPQIVLPSLPQTLHINRNSTTTTTNQRKRCFDVDSLLAPEQPCLIKRQKYNLERNEDTYSPFSKSDGSTDTDTST